MIFGNDHRDKTAYPGPIADFPVPLVPDYNLFWENIRTNLMQQVEFYRFAKARNDELP